MRRTIVILGAAALLMGCQSGHSGGSSATSSASASSLDNTWVYFVEPRRGEFQQDAPTPGERKRAEEHEEYVARLAREGVVVFAGPTLEEPYTGIVVIRAKGRAEAERIMEEDPAIRYGVFVSRLAPMSVTQVSDLDG